MKKQVSYSLNLDADEHQKLKMLSVLMGKTIATLLRELISEKIEKQLKGGLTMCKNVDNLMNCSATKMMKDACSSAQLYMGQAIEDIDKQLGEGYASEHPGLVGSYINAAASEFTGALIAQAIVSHKE